MIAIPSNLNWIQESVISYEGTTYGLIRVDHQKRLVVQGQTAGFEGEPGADAHILLCPLNKTNAAALRARLPWLIPVPLGLRTSAGFGDRLGIATYGHIQAVKGTGVAPILAQQSVRENTRTGRTPQGVMDDALWGVFEAGWRDPWGADADHLKTLADIPPFVAAGYSFYTIDPSDYVDDGAESDSLETLRAKAARLPWDDLRSSLESSVETYCRIFELGPIHLAFDESILLRALVKYGAGVAHTARMAAALTQALGDRPFELEMSVDETNTTTSLFEHFYIASELKRLEVPFVSLAPRFVGHFEKGVDYIGDLNELDQNLRGHAAIMGHFGDSYKLSLHTGSDKFSVYPFAARHTKGRVHLKTAGTSYLEALRLIATVEPSLFRRILRFARERYDTDRKTYHVSALLERVPLAAALRDEQLPALLDQFDARQVLHVCFGSVLERFGNELYPLLKTYQSDYNLYLKRHFDRHLEAFAVR
ncbi:MAG: hypothetical protein IT322_09170 [Anaerolineae bacterium]|nr:hypothetical protein [Anaerolineae bacterium]CAG0955039.1 tagaturonate epimerase [Anaerolineae bacterium]